MIKSTKTDLDFIELSKANPSTNLPIPKIKLAILADFTSQYLAPILKNIFLMHNIELILYVSDYNTIESNAYDPGSGLYSFNPDYIVVFNTTQALRERYYTLEGDKKDLVQQETDKICHIWNALKSRLNAPIIQTNFVMPYEKFYGNQDIKFAQSLRHIVLSLNVSIHTEAGKQQNVFIQDIDFIASYLGLKNWFDEKMWVLSKMPCAPNFLPHIAQRMLHTILSLRGNVIKCIILDLDNTLWGGIIGEDGMEGIRLGHYEDGESYQLFQKYLLELKKRGILLAVCSKNDADKAILPFQSHPEMILKENDITLFTANWESKAQNIENMKEILGISYESMVFLDDSAFERNLVSTSLPDVIVPELPEDPAEFVKFLSELNLFETTSISLTDDARTQLYRQEFERKNTEKEFSNHGDYLRSLSMKLSISRFDALELARIIQLMQRSNQFNLMTQRFNEAQCKNFMDQREQYLPFYIKLNDKYGDSGLISAIILKINKPTIVIEEWVMSCRVLARGVEYGVMNFIFNFATNNHYTHVIGQYKATDKNAMVKDFYKQFNFIHDSTDTNGIESWSLAVRDYYPKEVFFNEVHG